MVTQEFKVANVKCGGCAANIEKGLADIDGVEKVAVEVASGAVVVEGDAARDALSSKLTELGYPEL